MLRLIFIKVFVILFSFPLSAQNLIINGGFEDSVLLNFGFTEARYWNNPTSPSGNHFFRGSARPKWSLPQNFCGNQETRLLNENAYYGLLMYDFIYKQSREYIQSRLLKKLIKDSTYCFRMYVSLADSSNYGSRNQLGIYFSNSKISSSIGTHLPYTPQLVISPNEYITEKNKWLQYDLSFIADGDELFIVIGNFNDTTGIDTIHLQYGGDAIDYQMTYYYIDDLWLSHCDSLPDTSIGIWEQQAQHKLKLYPNPSNGLLNLESEVLVVQVKMYDVQGRLLQIIKQPAKQIQLPQAKGIFLLRLELENGEVLSRKVVRN